MAAKAKSAIKNDKKNQSQQDDLSNLAKAIITNAGVGIYIIQHGKFVYVSQLCQKLTGYAEAELIGTYPIGSIHPDDREMVREEAIKCLKGERYEPYEYRFFNKKHEVIWLLETITPIIYKGERATLGSFMDITDRKKAELQREAAFKSLQESEERLRLFVEYSKDTIFLHDFDGKIIDVNQDACESLGYTREELLDLSIQDIDTNAVPGKHKEKWMQMVPGEPVNLEGIHKRKDGTIFPIEVRLVVFDSGERRLMLGMVRDITERKRMEQELSRMATHDVLTGLPNRLMFSQLLNHAIQSARRHQRRFAVLFIDLDRFKTINDSLGHEAGDQLLQEIALRFKKMLRADDVVGRLGGDEFIMLIEEINDFNNAATIAQKIINTTSEPVVLLGEECRVTASIGISIYPQDGEDEQSLIKNADMAMYFAKEEGKNNYQFFYKDLQSTSIERLSIETNMRSALERNELFLEYQAKLDIKTGMIMGVEALLRWQSPSLGSVTPKQFIPVAEETGLIVPIGRWVIKTACAQNVAWQRQGLPPVCVAVNLSPRQLTDDNLLEDIRAALKDSGMAPNLLELEITESMIMHNTERLIAVLTAIKKNGVRLAIDNFGTGYSSLAQIKHFPIDTLKMDRSFIRNLQQCSEDRAITEAIIVMGKTLSFTVVAEGVETKVQKDFLREHVCDEIQGFYFSKPITPDQFADLLRNHDPLSQK